MFDDAADAAALIIRPFAFFFSLLDDA